VTGDVGDRAVSGARRIGEGASAILIVETATLTVDRRDDYTSSLGAP
jgi:hypothetical protein